MNVYHLAKAGICFFGYPLAKANGNEMLQSKKEELANRAYRQNSTPVNFIQYSCNACINSR
jgi:hypothetical protein